VFKRSAKGPEPDLVAAVDALFTGRYVEYLERQGFHVPPWAWTNVLAHGCEDQLHQVAGPSNPRRPEGDVWRLARSYLAGEVLDAAERSGSLLAVQAAALVPLELDLISWVPSRFAASGQWATRVITALEHHDSATRLI
jgi:hypothetical protein